VFSNQRFLRRTGSTSSQEEKQKEVAKPLAAFKDVKARVDTRWKKAEAPAQRPMKTTTSTLTGQSSTSSLSSAVPRPLISKLLALLKILISFLSSLGQVSKPKLPAEAIPQLRKVPSKPDLKKTSTGELQMAKSPRSLKLSKVKVESQNNYYESHSSKLLHQVEDIDEKDVDNPQLLAEYVQDIYSYLFKVERQFPIRENFLHNQNDVTPKMRSVLLDWINEVHNQFSLEIETYHMAVSMIDRYLQSTTTTPRRYLQLVGVTILFMASKYEELMPPEVTDFVYVTGECRRSFESE
jgi:G2/mitotic-specific cyclin-B2